MKVNPKKAAMIGLAASTLFATTGCGMLPGSNEPTTVYGPPEYFEEVEEDTTEEAPENDGNDQNE